jgi:hypothetical protein
MKTIYCVNSDSQVWNLETFLIELSFAMSQHSNITINMMQEGPDLNYLKITDFIKSLSNLYNYDLKKLVICINNVIQPDIPDIVIKKSSPLHHVTNTIQAAKSSQYTATKKNIKKVFGLFIGRGNAPRLDLSAYLYHNYHDKSLQTYHYDKNVEFHRNNIGIERLMTDQTSTNLIQIAEFLEQCPLKIVDEEITYPIFQHNYTELRKHYQDFFVEIICETYFSGQTFYPTEKTWRAVTMKTPFLIQGPVNFLKNLRKLGFKTFYQWWDESYDEDGGLLGINTILRNVDRLSKMSTVELQSMYNDMKPVLEHNYNVLIELTDKSFDIFYD